MASGQEDVYCAPRSKDDYGAPHTKDAPGAPHKPSLVEQVKEKVVDVKDKLTGHDHHSRTTQKGPGAQSPKGESFVQKLKEKLPGSHDDDRGTPTTTADRTTDTTGVGTWTPGYTTDTTGTRGVEPGYNEGTGGK